MADSKKSTGVQDEKIEVQNREHENEPMHGEATNIETTTGHNGPFAEAIADPNILKSNRVMIVTKLEVKDVLPCLEGHLNQTEMENVHSIQNDQEKTRRLIDTLYRRCSGGEYHAFNAFLKVVAGNQPGLFTELVGRAPTEEEVDFCVQTFAQALKEVIKDKGHSTDSPLDIKIDLDDEHIQLHVVKEQPASPETGQGDDDNQLPHVYLANLEKLEEAGQNIKAKDVLGANQPQSKRVLIRGRSGVGKTTTMQWFARQWAMGNWATGFTLLFLLPLRYLTDTGSMISAYELLTLYGFYKLDDKVTTSTCATWLKNSGNRLLMLVDGLDEISNFAAKFRYAPKITNIHEKANPVDLCINIIRGNIFRDCTIICTSRPFTGLSELTSFSKLEILGLTRAGVRNYIQSKYHENSKQISSVFESNPIIMSLSSITFYCALICSLLNDNITLEEEDMQTYTRLIACIIVKHVSRKLPDWPFVVEVSAYFSKLAKLAYNGIFKVKQGLSRVVFDEFDLAEVQLTPFDLESIKKVGLLQVKETSNKPSKSIRAEFLHLSIQEILAAAHCLSEESVTYDLLVRVFSEGQFDMALFYLFGLCFDKKSLWIKNVLAASGCNLNRRAEPLIAEFVNDMCHKPVLKLKLCQLIHEGQVENHARATVGQIVLNQAFTIQQIPMTILDLNALNFVCQFATRLTVLLFVNVNADDTFVRVFSSSFLKSRCNILQVLNLSTNRIQAEGAKILANALQDNRTLTALNISMNMIGPEGAKAIATMLKTKENLQLLDVRANNIGPVGATAIAESLSEKPRLGTLLIGGNNILEGGAKAIAEAVHGSTSLKTLDISANSIGDHGMRTFGEVLQANNTFCTLDVSHNLLCHNGAKAIGKLLCQNPKITHLIINGNNLEEDAPKVLTKGLEKIQFLDISGANLGVRGTSALFSALQRNVTLQHLNVSLNFMGEKGTKELCRMLKETTVLSELMLLGNDLGVSGAKELAVAISKNNSLRKLYVAGNDIGLNGEAVIRVAVAQRKAPLHVQFANVNTDTDLMNASIQLVNVQNFDGMFQDSPAPIY